MHCVPVDAVLRSLFDNLKRAHEDPRCKAIVLIGAHNNFSPGFDIQQFKNQVRFNFCVGLCKTLDRKILHGSC